MDFAHAVCSADSTEQLGDSEPWCRLPARRTLSCAGSAWSVGTFDRVVGRVQFGASRCRASLSGLALGVGFHLFGAVLSGFISEPSLVVASVSAFLFAELADFAVYAPMKKRYPAMAVIVSGLVGSAVDSAIFLSLAFGSVQYLFGQVLGKFWINLLAGVAIAVWRRRKQSVIAVQA